MNIKRFIYDRISALPPFLLLPLMRLNKRSELVFGNDFAERLNELQRKRITQDVINDQIIKITNYAINNVPYYSNKYPNIFIESVEDFVKTIQFTDKDIVVKNFENFISSSIDLEQYELQTTGGTSGKPLKIYQPKNRYIIELASVYNAWSKVGYKFDVRAVMRNHKLKNGRKFQINPITKEIQFHNFNINDEYLTEVYNIIKKYNIRYFHAYPSAAYQFAAHCKKEKLDLSFLKAFLCSSENILRIHRELIENELGIKILGFYGHTEKLVFASNCATSDFYHVDRTYGYFELIDEDGNAITENGAVGEIVGTTLTNKGMPLIRYKTGDFAEYFGEVCPHCGEKTTILKNILGRWNGDKIYNKDKTSITLTSLNLHGDIYTHIEGLQYFQPLHGVLEVRIIKSDTFNEFHEKQLLKEIGGKFKADLELTIKYVDYLQFQPNGKFLQLIN
jgi:phenylacetate-CoA ligase